MVYKIKWIICLIIFEWINKLIDWLAGWKTDCFSQPNTMQLFNNIFTFFISEKKKDSGGYTK